MNKAQELADLLEHDAKIGVTPGRADKMRRAATELRRLDGLINNAHTSDFLEAVRLEAAHQIERWGEAQKREKSAEAWYWLCAYLGGKALRANIEGDRTKALHHTISTAAALLQLARQHHEEPGRDGGGTGQRPGQARRPRT